MATKTITIMDDAYMLLLRNKMKSESFSEVIRRHFTRKRNIMEFAGAWKDMSDKEAEELKRNIENIGKRMTIELARKLKKLQ
ncbi:MAG: antitoxin VapB family protein [Nanoarchaeota archaeon]